MVCWFIRNLFFCTTPDWPQFHTLKMIHRGGLYKEDDIMSYNGGKVNTCGLGEF